MPKAARSKGGFTIEVGCPGCGGELELEENFFVLGCSHCGSILRIVKPEIPAAFLIKGRLRRNQIRFHVDRFLKKRKLPLTGSGVQIKNLYYPYWKIDALVARVRNRIERREIRPPSEYEEAQYQERERSEISIKPFTATIAAGAKMEGVPLSIGMRAEYIKLSPYSEEEIQDSYDSLPLVRPNDEALTKVALNFASAGAIGTRSTGVNRTELFDPTYSIIFFPFHVVEWVSKGGYSRYLLDGVTGSVLHHELPAAEDSFQESSRIVLGFDSPLAAEFFGPEDHSVEIAGDVGCSEQPGSFVVPETEQALPIQFGALGVELHRCPNCGEDLPGRQSRAYICRNCQEMVLLEKTTLPVCGIVQTAVDKNRDDRLFPFWSFKISEDDHSQLRRLFAGIFDSEHIVIPAFTLANFEAVYRLARRMSAALPKMELASTGHVDRRFLPVEIGPGEALARAHLVIYRAQLSKDQRCDPEELRFQPVNAQLIFASFHPQNYFYVDSTLEAVTFERNLVGG